MRVLVCGGRQWCNYNRMEQELKLRAHEIEVVIEGEARGADSLARVIAEKLGIPVLKFPAEWNKYGRAAGPIRNQQMLDEGKPDLVLAFHSDISKSVGTADMLRRAERVGIKTQLISC